MLTVRGEDREIAKFEENGFYQNSPKTNRLTAVRHDFVRIVIDRKLRSQFELMSPVSLSVLRLNPSAETGPGTDLNGAAV